MHVTSAVLSSHVLDERFPQLFHQIFILLCSSSQFPLSLLFNQSCTNSSYCLSLPRPPLPLALASPPPPLAPPSPVLVSRSLSFGCCLTSRFTSASCQGLLSSFISLCGFFGLFLSDSLSDDTRKFMKRRKWKGITGNVWCLGYQHSFIQAEANVWILCTKHLSVFLIYNKCSCFISVINIK